MALSSIIYRASIELSHLDRNLYETVQTTVAQHPSETEERLVARLLAHALFLEPELVFTRGICAGDEPDLWVRGAGGRVTLWLEVGLPAPERLIRASRHSDRVILLACGPACWNWQELHLAKLVGIPNLTIVTIDQRFLGQLASRLQRSIAWSLTVTEGTIYLTVGDETLETTLVRLVGPDPFQPLAHAG